MKVLVVYAHPAQRHSKVNTALARVAAKISGVSFLDLYALYPRFNIDVDREQARLVAHDAIVFQFPLMWYSSPPLVKEWMDLVLEYGFAYGAGGDKLSGKLWLNAISMGSAHSSYGPKGHNKFTLREMLAPIEATARLCQMTFLAPYSLFEALNTSHRDELATHLAGYKNLLEALRDDRLDIDAASGLELMDWQNIPVFAEEKTP